MSFVKLEAAIAHARTSSVCVDSRSCTKRCVLRGLARVAVAPCTVAALFRFPCTQRKHWNKHRRHCCPIRASAEMGLDMMYLPLSCLGHFQMLSSLIYRTQSAGYKCGLLHFTGRWALLLSSVILINSSCLEFMLSPPQMSFGGNGGLRRCKTAYSFLSEGFQKNLYLQTKYFLGHPCNHV